MLTDCSQEGCTVGTTGVCLLNNDTATCPHRTAAQSSTLEEEALLSEPEQNPSFGASTTLYESRLGEVMGDRYCTVIGILGAPDSGKTAALVSMYLKLCHGTLEGFSYADSKSLMALDEISRGARRWASSPPEQMTAHTELKDDDRAAGFLHLRIRSNETDSPVDFLLPDLPGEWSDAMVDESRYDRLSFLERADVIWLMVDGDQLTTPAKRHLSVHRTQLYLQRLSEFFPKLPRIILVVTRADRGTVSEKTVQTFLKNGAELGLDLTIHSVASFAAPGSQVAAGSGLSELIRLSLGQVGSTADDWPDGGQDPDRRRAMSMVVRGVDL
jgi:hypothetical protein